MAYLNRCEIIGNLGHEPKITMSQATGRKKATLSVAVTERYKDANGKTKENTNWFSVAIWGKLADLVEGWNLAKGTSVYVSGKINFRTTQDENENNRYFTELIADQLQLLQRKDANGNPISPTIADPDDLPF